MNRLKVYGDQAGYDQVIIVTDTLTGEHWIDGELPLEVSWCPVVLAAIRSGNCPWTDVSGDVITMHLRGGPVSYRLTGETDFGGGLVAELVGGNHHALPATTPSR
jgi:hypothetical protein